MKKEITDELFRDKYETYSKLLFRIAFLHLGNAHDAEDILNLSSVYYQPDKQWIPSLPTRIRTKANCRLTR